LNALRLLQCFSRNSDEIRRKAQQTPVDQNFYNTYIKKTVFNNWEIQVITQQSASTRVNTKNFRPKFVAEKTA